VHFAAACAAPPQITEVSFACVIAVVAVFLVAIVAVAVVLLPLFMLLLFVLLCYCYFVLVAFVDDGEF
jgi:hypothetical protein